MSTPARKVTLSPHATPQRRLCTSAVVVQVLHVHQERFLRSQSLRVLHATPYREKGR